MVLRAVIAATGRYLPEKIVSNKDLEKIVDTNDEWIEQRSGIKTRHFAAENQSAADLAIEAARDLIRSGNIDPQEIDCIIVATTTPDQTFPSVAVKVQAALDIPPCTAFDVQAVCTGFVYAFSIANSMIVSGQVKRVLVIGAEKMSSILNWEDRTTCVLFGDGAGAVLLEAQENTGANGSLSDQGVLSSHLYAEGRLKDILYVDGGVSSTKTTGHIVMQGKEVFKYAVQFMSDVVTEVLEKNKITTLDIDWLIPHQANIRIIEAIAKRLDLPMEKVIVTVRDHGNTSAASIPLALDQAIKSGRIKRGDMLLIEGMGGGLTWGAVLARY
ncbi:MAG: beta-ketoacyl-ACP synthase III [Alphaproteobacteria bacterium]